MVVGSAGDGAGRDEVAGRRQESGRHALPEASAALSLLAPLSLKPAKVACGLDLTYRGVQHAGLLLLRALPS